MVVDQILKEGVQVGRHLDVCGGDDLPGLFIDDRVNIKFEAALEHAAERFKNSTFEIKVIFFVKNFDQARHTHHETNHAVGVAREVAGKPIIFAEFGNQDGSA